MYRQREIATFLLCSLFILGTLPACVDGQKPAVQTANPPLPYIDTDAYSIYAILLEDEKRSAYVIRAETESRPDANPDSVGIKGDSDFQKMWGAALKAYANQFHAPKLLTRNIQIKTPYELVPEREIRAILKSGDGNNWGNFYARHPSRGYFSFSAVGFDPQRTHAIVEMNFRCGNTCGHGTAYFFEKKSGMWRKVSANASVVFWAS